MKRFITFGALAILLAVFNPPPSAAAPTQTAPSPFGTRLRDQVGVNIRFGGNPQPGEMTMLAQAGFGFVRMDMYWKDTEKQPGVYNFAALDALMAQLYQCHMRAVLILDYANPLYDGGKPPCTEEGRLAFTRWAVAAATHFRGRGVLWEMWNEPNGSFWLPHGNTAQYVALAMAVGKALRESAPGEAYIGPAGCNAYVGSRNVGVPLSFLEDCFKAGLLEYWQGVSVHPYRYAGPESVTAQYQDLASLITKYAPPGKSVPILAGEWGYSLGFPHPANADVADNGSHANTSDEATQADLFDREILTNVAAGVPLTIWYEWRDDSPKYADGASFGLVHNAYTAGHTPPFVPRRAYAAARTLFSLLGDWRFSTSIPLQTVPGAHFLSFVRGPELRYAIWTEAATPQSVTLPLPPGRYTLWDISGTTRRAVIVGRSGLPLTVTGSPQFIKQ